MGTLRDETYENLDYLSQLTEVVIAPQNEILAEIPDRIELNFEQINNLKKATWRATRGFEITHSDVLYSLVKQTKWGYIKDIEKHFEFEIPENFELDLVNKTTTGTIALVKKKHQLDDKELLKIAVEYALSKMERHSWQSKPLKERTITILNTFAPGKGVEWAKSLDSGRVSWQASEAINAALTEAILENKWRIRDVRIIAKIGEWISSYLADTNGTSVGLINLIKLKIMLDKDLPVYSIDEVKTDVNTP